MAGKFQLAWILPIISASVSLCLADFEVKYANKYIDYVWESDSQKQNAVDDGTYDYTQIIPFDIQPLSDGTILVATPKTYHDNPASLSTISKESGDGGPLLAPYPDWSWHSQDDCSGITSVNRVVLDDCGRIWVVDSGKIVNEQVCSPKVLAFDPTTNELVESFEIPIDLAHRSDDESAGRLEIQVVESTGENCANNWVYISDMDGFGLVIYDGESAWRLENWVFEPQDEGALFDFGEESFERRGGPEGLLLTPPGFLNETYLLMKSISYFKTTAARTEELHNSKYGNPVNYYLTNFTAPSQEPGKGWAKNGGTLVASFTKEKAIGCWNLQDRLEEEYIATVAQDDETMQYVPATKIITEDGETSEILYILSTRLQKYHYGSMDFDEINFRILRTELDDLVAGTVCEPRESVEIVDSIEDKDFFYHSTM